ncbi:MAG: hypothetical protein MI974_02500 [Chitinophagales bacterium]|nr:hypothetical protein [Chitinophagales bacterium]
MLIVVDSGSTKADWNLIDKGASSMVSTIGFNPIFVTEERMADELFKAFKNHPARTKASDIYFYGSGCWDANLKGQIQRALGQVFPHAHVEVEHDLLGAARSTCGTEEGIACILGTGSNSCLYDGKDVIDNVTNLGYLLGDEGSGTHLGKKLIRAYFYRELPKDLRSDMDAAFPDGKQDILDKIYGPETPNVYMASFTRFMNEHKSHPYIFRMIYRSFCEFIDRHVRKYDRHLNVPIHFIGSVGYHFQDILKIILEERCMEPGIFIKKPIDKLAEFHLLNTLHR